MLVCGAWLAGAAMARDLPPLTPLAKDRPYVLRTLYLEDPRLPTLTELQRHELYQRLERLMGQWYGYRVQVREVAQHGLADYFARHEDLFRRNASDIAPIEIDLEAPGAREMVALTIAKDFKTRDLKVIETYLRAGPLTSRTEAVNLATAKFTTQLAAIRGLALPDGTVLADRTRPHLNSYPHWNVMLRNMEEADFVLTNSVVVGADTDMPIYVISRGGVTTGITNNNDYNAYQGVSMVSLYPFLSDAPVFARERGAIPPGELLEVIATMCLHEFGHLFLRSAEIYDHAHCVHVAPARFDYYRWHLAIRRAGPCPLVHGTVPWF